jgi:hypothetical protein
VANKHNFLILVELPLRPANKPQKSAPHQTMSYAASKLSLTYFSRGFWELSGDSQLISELM